MDSKPIGWTMRGSADYRRVSLALFLAGFATFSLLYCVQPLLPDLARDFRISPAASSLALSLSSAFLALGVLCAGAVSEVLGRRGLMFASMASASLLNIVCAIMRAGTLCSSSGRWRVSFLGACRGWPWPISPRNPSRKPWLVHGPLCRRHSIGRGCSAVLASAC